MANLQTEAANFVHRPQPVSRHACSSRRHPIARRDTRREALLMAQGDAEVEKLSPASRLTAGRKAAMDHLVWTKTTLERVNKVVSWLKQLCAERQCQHP